MLAIFSCSVFFRTPLFIPCVLSFVVFAMSKYHQFDGRRWEKTHRMLHTRNFDGAQFIRNIFVGGVGVERQ